MLPNRQPSVANQEQQHVPSATCLPSRLREAKSFGTPSSARTTSMADAYSSRSLYNSRQKQNIEVIVLEVKECARERFFKRQRT